MGVLVLVGVTVGVLVGPGAPVDPTKLTMLWAGKE
jgi:hypothetical protein